MNGWRFVKAHETCRRIPGSFFHTRSIGCILRLVLTLFTPLSMQTAHAGLTRVEISRARFAPNAGVALPTGIALRETNGAERTLGALLGGKPALIMFADYTCTTLCGVALGALADALQLLPFRPETDYRVLIVGFNPDDGPEQAAAYREARVGGTAFARHAHFLSGDPQPIAELMQAVGLQVSFDTEHRQFAHPLGVLLIDPKGRIVRTLDPLALTPFDVRLALADTDRVHLATAADHLALLCYGWDAATGIYTLAIHRILVSLCALTVLTVGGAVLLLLRRDRAKPKTDVAGGFP